MDFVTGNQRGGVGKTTSHVNLPAALAEQGRDVVLLDLADVPSGTLPRFEPVIIDVPGLAGRCCPLAGA